MILYMQFQNQCMVFYIQLANQLHGSLYVISKPVHGSLCNLKINHPSEAYSELKIMAAVWLPNTVSSVF